jgi:hypothetical protein
MRIILDNIIIEKIIENPINGICGKISFIEADIAPISALTFITFPIISRITIGKATIFEYFLHITDVNPLPVTIPILAQVPTITVINGYRNTTNQRRLNPNLVPA